MLTTNHSRREFLRTTAAAGFALSVGAPLAACGDDAASSRPGGTLAAMRERGLARVGIANEPPTAFLGKDGQPQGYATDVLVPILKSLGIPKLEVVSIEFAGLIPALQARRFDVNMAVPFITPERCKQVIYAEPLVSYQPALAVRAGNPKGLTDFKSVVDQGARLGVLAGSAQEISAGEAGVDDGSLQAYADQRTGLEALRAGRVDAFADTSLATNYAILTDDLSDIEVGPVFPTAENERGETCEAFCFNKDDTALRDAVNERMLAMIKDGTALGLVSKYGVMQADFDAARGFTADGVCSGAAAKS